MPDRLARKPSHYGSSAPASSRTGPANQYISTSVENLVAGFVCALSPPSDVRADVFNLADAEVDPSIANVAAYVRARWPYVPLAHRERLPAQHREGPARARLPAPAFRSLHPNRGRLVAVRQVYKYGRNAGAVRALQHPAQQGRLSVAAGLATCMLLAYGSRMLTACEMAFLRNAKTRERSLHRLGFEQERLITPGPHSRHNPVALISSGSSPRWCRPTCATPGLTALSVRAV